MGDPTELEGDEAAHARVPEVGLEAHRPGRVDARIHRPQVVGDPWSEAHLRENVPLDVDSRRDLGQHEAVVGQGEDRPLGDVAHLLARAPGRADR